MMWRKATWGGEGHCLLLNTILKPCILPGQLWFWLYMDKTKARYFLYFAGPNYICFGPAASQVPIYFSELSQCHLKFMPERHS